MSILKRLVEVQNISNDYLSITPPVPKSVKIELTGKCNYKCSFCSHTEKLNSDDMDWDLFVKITTELKKLGIKEIGPFLIGEPFLSPDLLIKAVKFLKQDLQIPYVFLTSNGSRATPEVVEELMKVGLDSLKWSVNFADWFQFEALSGMPAKFFLLAKKNIEAAWNVRQKGYSTKLYASSIMFDNKQPERFGGFLEKHVHCFVDEFYWLPLYSFGGKKGDIVYKSGHAQKREEIYSPISGNTGSINSALTGVPCWTLFTAAHVMNDGIMTACCTDATGDWAVGDLKTEDFMSVWHSKKFQKLRKAHLTSEIRGTKCERCIYG